MSLAPAIAMTKTTRRHLKLLNKRLTTGQPLKVSDRHLLTAVELLVRGQQAPQHNLRKIPVPKDTLTSEEVVRRLEACARELLPASTMTSTTPPEAAPLIKPPSKSQRAALAWRDLGDMATQIARSRCSYSPRPEEKVDGILRRITGDEALTKNRIKRAAYVARVNPDQFLKVCEGKRGLHKTWLALREEAARRRAKEAKNSRC